MHRRMISLVLVDDHALLRGMLADRLSREHDLEVVGTAANAADAVRAVVQLRPAIVLMDIDMRGLLCFEAVKRIRKAIPATKVVFLSAFFYDRYIEQALAVGAAGYITKEEPPDVIVKAVRTVAAGGSYFSPAVQARLVIGSRGASLARDKTCSRADTLTAREAQILRYIAQGMSQTQIAHLLGRSSKTVHRHCANLMNKLDIHDRVELTRFAIREGVVEA